MKYRFRTRPYRHQFEALKLLLRNGGGFLAHDMGTGKTKTAIDFASAMHLKEGTTRVLVLTRKSMLGTWPREVHTHGVGSHECLPHDLGPDRDTPEGRVTWRISNYERLLNEDRYQFYRRWLQGDPHSILICDESHVIKNPNAKRSKKTYGLGQGAGHRVMLTGTMVTRNPLDLFMQFKVLDDSVFGTRFAHFRRRYAVMGGYGGYEVKEWVNLDELSQKMAPITHRAIKEDCLDLPGKTHVQVPIHIDGKTAKAYDEMAEEAVTELGNEKMSAALVITRTLRLRQITGGWAKTDAGDYVQLGTEKQDALQDLLEDILDTEQRVGIFCNFLKELEAIQGVVQKLGAQPLLLHGGVSPTDRELALERFQSDDPTPYVFISQIDTGALGITLTRARQAIFYSHPHSFGVFAQACDRFHRIGQQWPVTYYHLLAAGTIDEVVYEALENKRALAQVVSDHPAIVRRRATA